ncbi:MAG: hypothetical protein JNK12_04530 [Acidimicrobiales bacterium]|nr:hypothetical protein [Acidimicrobiales bacterium]
MGRRWDRIRTGLEAAARYAWAGTPERAPRAWLHCPICDARLDGPYLTGHRAGTRYRPNRDELVAACPVHGHPPYNVPTERRVRLLADDEADPLNSIDRRRRPPTDAPEDEG